MKVFDFNIIKARYNNVSAICGSSHQRQDFSLQHIRRYWVIFAMVPSNSIPLEGKLKTVVIAFLKFFMELIIEAKILR